MLETSIGHYDGMLNAGFCAVIITVMTEGATRVRQERPARTGLPWISAYLLVPLALHQNTSCLLRKSRHRGLAEFMNAHPELTIGLDRRIVNMAPHVRSGLSMALLRNSIQVDEALRKLVATSASTGERDLRLREILDDEDYDRMRVSARLGEWAAQISVPQICGALLVHPTWARPSQADTTLAQSDASPGTDR
jgi:hypothetical protein